jgi:hypothetical protein
VLNYFCPKCYAKNRADDEVCRSCGARLDEEGGDYVERLIRFSLHHPVPSIPPMAAETLGKIGDKRAVEPLMDVLRSSEDPGLLEAAAQALGRLKDDRAIHSLQGVLKRGTLAVRMSAVDALGEIGGDEAIRVLREVVESDPGVGIRQEAESVLQRLGIRDRQDARQVTDAALAKSSEPHKRGISITLSILDETLCEVEQWANGREVQSVLYRERNVLSSRQKQEILAEIAQMRSLLQELQEALGLEPTVQDAGAAIRGKCAGLWEHIVELKAKYLTRYGDVPACLGDYLDPRAERLIQGITHILDALKRQVPGGEHAQPGQKPDDG